MSRGEFVERKISTDFLFCFLCKKGEREETNVRERVVVERNTCVTVGRGNEGIRERDPM